MIFDLSFPQKKGSIEPQEVKETPVYDNGGFSTVEIWLEYGAREVISEATSVEVSTPDNHHVVAEFDLLNLR